MPTLIPRTPLLLRGGSHGLVRVRVTQVHHYNVPLRPEEAEPASTVATTD